MSEDEKKRIMRMIEQEDSSDEDDDDSDLKEGQNSTSQKLNKEGKAGA